MTRKDLQNAYAQIKPTNEEKTRIYQGIVSAAARRQSKRPLRRTVRKSLAAAAVIGVFLLLMCGAAVAASLHNLNMLIIDSGTSPTYLQPDEDETVAFISLQGYVNTPGYLACQEWLAYQASQEWEPENWLSADEVPAAYWAYMAYTQEAMDKVDAICEKYGLVPHGRAWIPQTGFQEIFDAVGIDGILAADTQEDLELYDNSGYYYSDGSFAIEGEARLTSLSAYGTVSYQYRCIRKTAFDVVTLKVGDVDAYDQWIYLMDDGTEALLCVGPTHSLAIVDLDTCFVTINCTNLKLDGGGYRECMETFINTFDFGFTPRALDPETIAALEAERPLNLGK